jgi:hypothetical protein
MEREQLGKRIGGEGIDGEEEQGTESKEGKAW